MGNDYSTCCQSRATAANEKDLPAKARRLSQNAGEGTTAGSYKEVHILEFKMPKWHVAGCSMSLKSTFGNRIAEA